MKAVNHRYCDINIKMPKKLSIFEAGMRNLLKTYIIYLEGSGYTFFVLKQDKTIDIINIKNQDMPQLLGYIPLLTIDLWEHAYYLNYENEKSRYIDNFKEIIDFTTANKTFNTIIT